MIVIYSLTYIIVESLIREVWLLIPFLLDEMTVHFSKYIPGSLPSTVNVIL